MTDHEEYNGWTNYATWNVALWVDNDPFTYARRMELLREAGSEGELAAALREWIEDESPLADDASLYADLLGHALRSVDWREIARNWWTEREAQS